LLLIIILMELASAYTHPKAPLAAREEGTSDHGTCPLVTMLRKVPPHGLRDSFTHVPSYLHISTYLGACHHTRPYRCGHPGT
jgi:hypothetical protein